MDPTSKRHRNVRRLDKPNFHGWLVTVKRRGRHVFSETFSDSHYGDSQRALERALLRRDEVESALPPPTHLNTKKSRRNRSGTLGISLVERRRGDRCHRYWVAHWTELDGRKVSKMFAESIHGPEEARQRAIAARREAARRILGATGVRPWFQKPDRAATYRNVVRIESAGSGWFVRVMRRSAYFADSDHGGRSGALARALECRDAFELEHPPLPRLGRPPRSGTGILGVYRFERVRSGRRLRYYVAHWAELDGTPGYRTFACSKYGAAGARALAISARHEAVARIRREAQEKQLARVTRGARSVILDDVAPRSRPRRTRQR
jgi:hypothetical protein